MADGLRDRMSVGDQQVKFSLRCARCDELVEFGKDHECKKEEVDEKRDDCGTPD